MQIVYEDVFNESLARIKAEHGDHFFEKFYQNFFSVSDEIKEKFKNTDMENQKNMLKKSFYFLLDFFTRKEGGEHMQKLGAIHSKKQYDIRPELYDVWLDALVKTVRECDPLANDHVELAWRIICSPGITYMRFLYDK